MFQKIASLLTRKKPVPIEPKKPIIKKVIKASSKTIAKSTVKTDLPKSTVKKVSTRGK